MKQRPILHKKPSPWDHIVFTEPKYEEYDYEKYRLINSELSERMYEYLHLNRELWKIVCGKRIEIEFYDKTEVLNAVWIWDISHNEERKNRHGYDGYQW